MVSRFWRGRISTRGRFTGDQRLGGRSAVPSMQLWKSTGNSTSTVKVDVGKGGHSLMTCRLDRQALTQGEGE